jgi:hypothetical protein
MTPHVPADRRLLTACPGTGTRPLVSIVTSAPPAVNSLTASTASALAEFTVWSRPGPRPAGAGGG